MALAVPPDARASKVVEAIYRLFFASGAWPTFTELDRYLDMRGEPDAETVLVGPPASTAYGVEFDDARGQRWQLSRGAVIAIDKMSGGPARTATGQLVVAQTLDLAQPISGFLSSNTERVAFISYVHEDRGAVDHLQRSLEETGITVWRDLDQLLPGQSKRQKIVDAIRHQSFAFYAASRRRELNGNAPTRTRSCPSRWRSFVRRTARPGSSPCASMTPSCLLYRSATIGRSTTSSESTSSATDAKPRWIGSSQRSSGWCSEVER